MKLILFIFILLYSFNIYCNEITILKDLPGSGFKIVNHTKVKVHYKGMFEDGTVFDSSYKRENPIAFQIGTRQVILGWELGLLGMQIGGKRTILIPPELAYGLNGAGDIIPPNSTLIFEIEIIDAIPPKYRTIDSKQLLLALTGNYIIMDIRTKKERQKTGIIPGSILLTAFDNSGNFYPNFLKSYNDLIDDSDKVIFVSDKGEISSILANGFVENFGKKNIYTLKGGIKELIKDNFNLIKN
tara:strand:+ start:5654 stop:6379 length:726 start_codon:yes stop_codon:yes gene_type:complete